MQEPGNRSSGPIQDQPNPGGSETDDSYDPYSALENVFDEPIVLEEADLETFEAPEQAEPGADEGATAAAEQAPAAAPRGGEGGPDLWARFMALEAEVRSGSERTLEALRRLGERMGSELAMLDKRAINLELTLARLRSIIESSDLNVRRTTPPTQGAAPDDGAEAEGDGDTPD